MTRGSVIITGLAGTGKTAVVKEAAWRIRKSEPPFGGRLKDCDIFELVPAALQANSKYAGMYEERINQLVKILELSPKVIIFVDEIHSMFQATTTGDYDVFSRGNQLFKKYLAEGSITFIGCTTIQEYRRFIEPDAALARRFGLIKIDPPSVDTTVRILESRRKDMETYYNLRLPDAVLKTVVDTTEEYLPSRQQPDKSIQLLDEVCAWCATAEPAMSEATPDVPRKALAQMLGRPLSISSGMTETTLQEQLGRRIRGHNEVLTNLARAVIAGLGKWMEGGRPRGVFLFAGPTGVGKTETARQLAEALGGGHDVLIEIDCNTLQGSDYNVDLIMGRLMGPPPGFQGYGLTRGGLLSRIRDMPEAIVLFDEFEKAAPVVGDLLLQIIDEGRIEDTEYGVLDFRRSFVIFTTNSGAEHGTGRRAGFAYPTPSGDELPRVTSKGVFDSLKRLGFGDEFIGRITHAFLFQGLERTVIREVLEDRLAEMANEATMRNWRMTWEPEVVEHLTALWEPRYGVRHLISILRNRIIENVNVADAQGELNGIEEIRLEVLKPEESSSTVPVGSTRRERRNTTMVIVLV